MKKLVAFVLALGVSGGLAFAKYSSIDFNAVDTEQVVMQSTTVVSLEQAIDEKLAEAILVAQLNRDVESGMQLMISDMDAEIESELLARFDSIELAR